MKVIESVRTMVILMIMTIGSLFFTILLKKFVDMVDCNGLTTKYIADFKAILDASCAKSGDMMPPRLRMGSI